MESITKKLDELTKQYKSEQPFLSRDLLVSLFGEHFFEEAYKATNHHVFFEENKTLYHVTITRETILKEYAVLKRNGKLYEKVSDEFINHLINEEKKLEEELAVIKKITDHSSIRLKKLFKK